MPDLVVGTAISAALILLSAAFGRRLLGRAKAAYTDPWELGAIAIVLGLGAFQAVPFILFSLGAGHPVVFRVVVGALVLFLLPDVIAVMRTGARALGSVDQPRWWTVVPMAALAALAAAMLVRATCPVSDDDGLSYHLAAAVRYLQAGRYVFLPTLTYTHWPVGVEGTFAMLRGLIPWAPVAVVQWVFGGVAATSAILLARRAGGWRAAVGATCLLPAYAVFWEETAFAHVDLGLAVFATGAVLALVTGGDHPAGRRVGAILAGLTVSEKLLGIWTPVTLAALLAIGARRSGWRAAAARSGGFLLIALVVAAPWFVRSWVLTGNPVYPMFYSIFGGREWTTAGWQRMRHYFLLMNTPPGCAPTIPVLIASRVALVGVMGLIALAVVRSTRHSASALQARYAAVVSVLIFLGSGYNLRFLIVAYPCAIAAVAPLANRRCGNVLVALCALAPVLAFRAAVVKLEPSFGVAWNAATGAITRSAYLTRVLPDYGVVSYVNTHLPRNSHLLVATWREDTALYQPMAFRANYWLQDSVHYDSRERLRADLARLGITYIVLEPMDPSWCTKSAVCTGRETHETQALERFTSEEAVPVFRDGTVTLWRLHSAASCQPK